MHSVPDPLSVALVHKLHPVQAVNTVGWHADDPGLNAVTVAWKYTTLDATAAKCHKCTERKEDAWAHLARR